MADNKPVNLDAYLSRKEAEIQQEARDQLQAARDKAAKEFDSIEQRYIAASDNDLKDEYLKAQEALEQAEEAYKAEIDRQTEAAQDRIEEAQIQERRNKGDLHLTESLLPEMLGGANEEQRKAAERAEADKKIEEAKREKEEADKKVRDIQAKLKNKNLSADERKDLMDDLGYARDDAKKAAQNLEEAEADKAEILKEQAEESKENADEKARMDSGNLTWWERNAPFEWMGRASDEQIKAYDKKKEAEEAKEEAAEKARMDSGNLTWWERNMPEWAGGANEEQMKAYEAKEREANIQEAKKKEADIQAKLKNKNLSADERKDLVADLEDVREDLQDMQPKGNDDKSNNSALNDGIISTYERYAHTSLGGASKEEIATYDAAESINIKGVSTQELIGSPVLRKNLAQIKKAQELAAKTDGQVDIQDYVDAGLRPELAKQVAREIYQANQTNDGTERPQAPKVADNSR
ncbi:MAG: hypothetical protein IJC11_03365 [Alphaproteobacteria bacterium]|nr:hypothetical protein [Alphaproteobacteria bacterium]